jgi:two-component system chemotaxis sensor kinase CheA
MNYSDDRVREFLTESQEHLDRIDRDIVTLEKDPENDEALAGVFRAMHTMKGTCSFFGFVKLETLAHAGEDILTRLRDREIRLDGELVSALLALFDAIRRVLSSIEATRTEGEDDNSALLAALARMDQEKGIDPRNAGRPAAPAPVPPAADPHAAASEGAPGESEVPVISETSVRVDVSLLDKLMNLVGELVLARNHILQIAAFEKDRSLVATSQRLNLITTEIQEEVMRTRLQRVGNLWDKFPRVVRDLSVTCGKEARIEFEGEETELDRSIIEAVKAPLTHLLRNAVDHGIEAPEIRIERGKSRQGRIRLRAFHENGQVNIHLSDDGAGIDLDRVKDKAIQSGLTAERVAQMSHREVLDLIFLPGFSTAEKVTNLSGRGVGMDVVRSGIEKVGGSVDIDSWPGQGVTVRMKIPLTLAILPALIVSSGGHRYAIPQVGVLELVRLGGSEARKEIEFVKDAPVYRLRGDLIPLVWLDQELDEAPRAQVPREGRRASIVVLQAEGKSFGLVVEKVNDTQEIVVKPLGRSVKALSLFAGATVMGDGRVALILDVSSLARRAGVLASGKHKAPAAKDPRSGAVLSERRTVLLFRGPGDRRMAIPLSMVARLEEFRRAEIEMLGERAVVQYRGEILPLVPVFDLLESGSRSLAEALETDSVQVVVTAREDQAAGLLVNRILDIVEQPLAIQRMGARKGVLGTMVLQGRVTEVLDVEGVIQLLDPGFFAVNQLVGEGAA